MSRDTLRIGFIPLVDAATVIVAADKGFNAAEDLDVELVREVSWSNIRDKLNVGAFDAGERTVDQLGPPECADEADPDADHGEGEPLQHDAAGDAA